MWAPAISLVSCMKARVFAHKDTSLNYISSAALLLQKERAGYFPHRNITILKIFPLLNCKDPVIEADYATPSLVFCKSMDSVGLLMTFAVLNALFLFKNKKVPHLTIKQSSHASLFFKTSSDGSTLCFCCSSPTHYSAWSYIFNLWLVF